MNEPQAAADARRLCAASAFVEHVTSALNKARTHTYAVRVTLRCSDDDVERYAVLEWLNQFGETSVVTLLHPDAAAPRSVSELMLGGYEADALKRLLPAASPALTTAQTG